MSVKASPARLLNLLIVAVVVAGAVAALAALRLAPGGPTGDPAVFLVLALAGGAAQVFSLVIVRNGETEDVDFEEGVLAAMFLLLPVPGVLAATLVSTTIGQLRSRSQLRKAAFNYGARTLGVSLGLMVQRAVATPADGPPTPRELAGAGLGVGVFTILVVGLVWTAISLASGERFRDIAARGLPLGSVTWSIALAWGLVTAMAARSTPVALLVGIVPLVVLRELQRAEKDRHHLRGLLRTAMETTAAVRAGTVEPSVLAAATDVLDAGRTELRPAPPGPGEIGALVPSARGDRWLVVGERGDRDPFGDHDRALLAAMAAIAAVALDNACLVEQVGHDPVIGLPYSTLFGERVALAVADADGVGRVAVLVVRIDRLDVVERTLGPEPATALLADIGARFSALLDGEALARFATRSAGYLRGGEFAAVLAGVRDDADALEAARLVADSVRAPFEVEGIEVALGATVGVALQAEGDHATKPNDLIRDALDTASRIARTGSATVALAAPRVGRASERLELEAELRRGIEHGQLVVHYQPELDVATGRVVGMEALVRWRHPTRGTIPPSEFIPLAEETGLIVDLDRVVLATACRQVAEWRARLPGAESLAVSVNLAARHVGQADLPDFVASVLARTGLEPDALRLEVTETDVMHDPASAATKLHALRRLGVRLGIDDFGTGYSSLLYLRELPVEVLKVDRSFVAGMADRPDDGAIVAATVRLAHALGLHVVAEGVETEDQLTLLRLVGCDHAQGYLWSPPVAVDEFERWWRSAVVDRCPAVG